MGNIIDIIITPFSWLLTVFYDFLGDYGLAIILFAFVVKLVLFPTSLKSKKSMIQMSMLSGQLDQLKKQYGKDQARYNQEMQKLYEREKINPMGGCLWSFLPLLILLPLYSIIRMPLKYMMGLSNEQMMAVATKLNWGEVAYKNGWIKDATAAFDPSAGYNQLYLASLIKEEDVAMLSETVGEGAKIFQLDFKFLGIDLAAIPQWKLWAAENFSWATVIGPFVLVILSTLLSVVMSKVSSKTNQLNQSQQSGSNKMLLWLMPAMSLWIGFMMPAAMCIYWIANSLFSMVQEIIASRMLKKEYEKARVAAEERAKRLKEEEKERKEQARLEKERRAEEAKQARKKGIKAESDGEAINKDDSREGLRAHARGRAYIPDRFGGVTEYTDPDILAAEQAKMDKKKKKTVSGKVDLTGAKDKSEPADQKDEKQETEERE